MCLVILKIEKWRMMKGNYNRKLSVLIPLAGKLSVLDIVLANSKIFEYVHIIFLLFCNKV